MAFAKRNLKSIGIAVLVAIFICTTLSTVFLLLAGINNNNTTRFVSAAEGLWTDYATEPTNSGDGDNRSNPIYITQPSELAWLASQVNSGNDFAGKYLQIGNMDLGEHYWVPIGTVDNPFRGNIIQVRSSTVATINNLTIDTTILRSAGLNNISYLGLFGYVDRVSSLQTGNGYLEAITLENVNINIAGSLPNTDVYVGSLIGYMNGSPEQVGTGINAFTGAELGGNSGTIFVDLSQYNTSFTCYVGGLIGGLASDGKLGWTLNTRIGVNIDAINCESQQFYAGGVVGYNLGTITGSNTLTLNNSTDDLVFNVTAGTFGGVVGLNGNTGQVTDVTTSATINNDVERITIIALGGIVGTNSSGTITNCTNVAQITASSGTYGVGGIVGSNSNATINNCSNTATINIHYGNQIYVGGIAGYTTGTSTIIGCSNSGQITGVATQSNDDENRRLGGIVGYAYSNTTGIYNCHNTASIGANVIADYVGGIVGYNNGTISNASGNNNYGFNYNTGDICGARYVGGIAGLNSNSISYSYNLGDVWGTDASQSRVGGIIGSSSGVAENISYCFNNGLIGGSTTAYAGGITGYVTSITTLNNVINYANISANLVAGGIIGYAINSANITMHYCVSVGDVNDAGTDSNIARLGGIVGQMENANSIASNDNFTYSVYDKSVANYDDTLDSRDNGMRVIYNSVGGYESIERSDTSYNLTLPAATSSNDNATIRALAESADWYFPTANEAQNRHYYPILSCFRDGVVFDMETTGTSGQVAYPNVVIYEVNMMNYKPVWNDETQEIEYETTQINPFTVGTAEYTESGVQYINAGQKLRRLTDTEQYGVEGYTEVWRTNTDLSIDSNIYDFDTQRVNADITLYLTWEGERYNVYFYMYNNDSEQFELVQDFITYPQEWENMTIQYSLNPNEMAHINEYVSAGMSFQGWWTSLEDAESGDTDLTTLEFSRNVIYGPDGLCLYGKATPVVVTITLNAGMINGVAAHFADGTTEKQVSVTYGERYTFDVDFQDYEGWSFTGYYATQLDNSMQYTDLLGNSLSPSGFTVPVTVYAHWLATAQRVAFMSVNTAGEDVILLEISVDFNNAIPSNQIPTDSDINYAMVDATKDPNGYRIFGFYKDRMCTDGNEFNFESLIMGETIIYVRWQVQSFELTLNANGGTFTTGSNVYRFKVEYGQDLLQTIIAETGYFGTPTLAGYMPLDEAGVLLWSTVMYRPGENFDNSTIVSVSNNNYSMPARNLELYIVWETESFTLILRSNGGAFADGTTQILIPVAYGQSISTVLSNQEAVQNIIPTRTNYGFRFWSLDSDANAVEYPSNLTMPSNDLTLYAIWGEQVIITFYALGIHNEDILYTFPVFRGEVVQDVEQLADIEARVNSIVNGSGFLFDHWEQIISVNGYNYTTSSIPFNFDTTIINDNIMLMASLELDPNFKPVPTDTTNYLIIAIIVILIAVVLMFLLIWTNMRKNSLELEERKIKNKDIQKQLDEIKELERRRKELDNPYE